MTKKRRNLKQRRKERPTKQSKRQRQREKQMQTLDGRLIRYCQLNGITPEVTPLTVRCTMPNGVELVIYKRLRRIYSYGWSTNVYGVIDYPWRSGWNRVKYLDDKAAHRLFDKIGEKIVELESGKVSPSAGEAESRGQSPYNPSATTHTGDCLHDPPSKPQKKLNLFDRLVQFVIGKQSGRKAESITF